SAIVFVGDNVYPRGIPARENDTTRYNEARTRLLLQADLADSTGLRAIFVPGNHDWARHQEDGWASVQRSDLILREFAKAKKAKVEQLPELGCPGPTATNLARGVRLIAIDTQWWLHSVSRPGRFNDSTRRALPRPDVVCGTLSEKAVTDSLRKLFHG